MTSQTAGKSIFFSGVAVLIGLFGMLFIDLSIYRFVMYRWRNRCFYIRASRGNTATRFIELIWNKN